MATLPPPPPEAIAHSQHLVAVIQAQMAEAGGILPFADFMYQALYSPGLGYYSAGNRKFGIAGDFITAPELSPLFSQCLAQQCQQVLEVLNGGVILELGAGSGIMALDILQTLAHLNTLPDTYFILEPSADLQQRQQARLAKHPDLYARVQWLTQWPAEPLKGIILANEVLDALPVHRFQVTDQAILAYFVLFENEQFNWHLAPIDDALKATIQALALPVGYTSEINPLLPAWIRSIATILAEGMVLLLDYGFPSTEYYHPQRSQGTLMCHYRHYAHDNPLILVGLQDITAHVNFSAVAEAAIATDLQVSGYTSQANFLLACGLIERLATYNIGDTQTYLRLAQQTKTLILPSEMGELFKVMALTRGLSIPLLGFSQDNRSRL